MAEQIEQPIKTPVRTLSYFQVCGVHFGNDGKGISFKNRLKRACVGCWGWVLQVFLCMKPNIFYCCLWHKGRNRCPTYESVNFWFIFVVDDKSRSLYFPPNTLCVVEATTFNSNAWKRSSGSILEGNFIVYEESSWVQVNLSLDVDSLE